jgi:hypothetical protein
MFESQVRVAFPEGQSAYRAARRIDHLRVKLLVCVAAFQKHNEGMLHITLVVGCISRTILRSNLVPIHSTHGMLPSTQKLDA